MDIRQRGKVEHGDACIFIVRIHIVAELRKPTRPYSHKCGISEFRTLGPQPTPPQPDRYLSNQRRGGCSIILEIWLNDLLCLIVPRQTMDSALDEDKTEFGVLVFSVDL